MKLLQNLLIALVMMCSLASAQPSFADRPPVINNPDYIAITEELATATDPTEIAKLQFEKYIIETGESFAECRNLTNAPLLVYGKKPKGNTSTFDNALYVLPSGKTTDEDWNCQGVYLPDGLDNQSQAVAVKIVPGTQLIARANANTGAVELNIPAAKVFQPGEVNWEIPATAEELQALQVKNAPLD